MYKTMVHKDFDFLRSIISPERILIGDAISDDYAHDELGGVHRKPEALIRVMSTNEISKIMQYAMPKIFRSLSAGAEPGWSARVLLFVAVLCWKPPE